jgi:hypothetical protein
MASKSGACKFVHLPYQLNLWLHIGFLPWNLLNPSPTFSVSRCLSVLISCCCPTWMNLLLIFYLAGTPLGGRKSYVEFKQESLAQLSLAFARCSLVLYFDLRIIFVLILNLVTTLLAIPPCMALVLTTHWCHLKFHFRCAFSNGVISSRWWCRDETKGLLWL